MYKPRRIVSVSFILVCILALLATSFANSNPVSATTPSIGQEPKSNLVTIQLTNRSELDKLVSTDLDLTEHVAEHNGMIEVDAIVSDSEMATLKLQGYKVDVITTREDVAQILSKRKETVKENTQLTATTDTVDVLRANFFTNQSGTFLYVEAKSSAGEAAETALTATWLEGNSEKTAALDRVSDAGEYLYHSLLLPISEVPSKIKITSNVGGSDQSAVSEWVGDDKPTKKNKHFVSDFVDHYMTPTEVTERIMQLAEEFPELAEIVDLPYKTNGYRRHAQAVLGDRNSDSAIVVTSNAWGHEGGNDIVVNLEEPGKTSSPLTVKVDENAITVSLATDAAGKLISTGNDVLKALNEEVSSLLKATEAYSSTGAGILQPQEAALTDYLNASEAEVSHDPYQVKAIRIGKHRDGSKPGVLAYAQEHAREWVTPLVAVETAERLLRNYAHDAETKKLVNNLDIFIVPTVNPDGGHYSFYDYNWQRKNMVNYCDGALADPYLRNYWGVDLNRNHSVGSAFDGYVGASTTNCTSGTFAGTSELSEPEAHNIIWLADENPNIKFAMNIHSYGGYFMWPPGAYKAEGRETLPRPTAGEEAFFWSASDRILDEIKDYRGTVILPSRTGPVPDVLYSAAGNSADALWYENGIYAWDFEVGADLWNAEKGRWEGVGFQPPFSEGHEEAMEFANGLTGLLKVAYDFAKDHKPPKTSIDTVTTDEGVKVTFKTSEPATIFYTLDGSKPTFKSKTLDLKGLRETTGESLILTQTTKLNWFSMDASGNTEKNYDPEANGKNYNSSEIKVK